MDKYTLWQDYYDNNGLSWLASQHVGEIKKAFFAGIEAAEQGLLLTIHPLVEFLSDPDKFSASEQNPIPSTRK